MHLTHCTKADSLTKTKFLLADFWNSILSALLLSLFSSFCSKNLPVDLSNVSWYTTEWNMASGVAMNLSCSNTGGLVRRIRCVCFPAHILSGVAHSEMWATLFTIDKNFSLCYLVNRNTSYCLMLPQILPHVNTGKKIIQEVNIWSLAID